MLCSLHALMEQHPRKLVKDDVRVSFSSDFQEQTASLYHLFWGSCQRHRPLFGCELEHDDSY